MNARNHSGMRMPRDGVGQPQLAGWVSSHPLEWGLFATPPGNSGPSTPAVASGQDDPRVVAALEEYLMALRTGQPASRAEFLAEHAEIADALGECLSVLEFIQSAADYAVGSGGLASASAEPIAVQAQLGDYRILREVGRGGMGVVYEAEQISLGRRVALKVLPFAAAIDPKQRQRFQIEAQAAAQLHHPHIVPIFGVGCDRGIHYYAMQFVDGRSLAAIIHEWGGDQEAEARGGAGATSATGTWGCADDASPASTDPKDAGAAPASPDDRGAIDRRGDAGTRDGSASGLGTSAGGPSRASTAVGPVHRDPAFCRDVARLGIEAADALDHAHGLGVLHRDIKPANLLIDRHGALWITDFGLARFPSEFSITGTGDLIGTLRYMSPEQALARRGVVDQRTDIYALGVTLYELLTLRPAFDGRDHHELLRQIATDEPVPPRRLNPAIPRDLETIVLKAMAKDPSHRYATAQELAADLGRFLADEPILARRPGAVERTLRWARRHRELMSTAAAIVLVSLSISTMLVWGQARKAGEARNAYHAYLIESYPLLDQVAMEAIDRAFMLARGQDDGADLQAKLTRGPADPADRQEALRTVDQWLKILQQTSELPRADSESRIIIGRASTRLGYARTLLALAKVTPDGRPDPASLAQANEDFHRSIALFEELLAASPGDANVRRYLADAVGLFGQGCCYRFASREGDAESCYRRAIQLRRDLVRAKGSGGANSGAHVDQAGEVSNFARLIGTVQTLAGIQQRAGRRAEAEGIVRQLEDDVVAAAARFSGPDFASLRSKLAGLLVHGESAATADGRRMMIQYCRWALVLDPEHAIANNNLAWALASVPDDPWYDPKQALELARKAVARNPLAWASWNTLGVVAYRVGDWETAADSLQRSIQIYGGVGFDCFFLAMTRWQQGQRKEARQWFDQAISWIERTKSKDAELDRFHAEAAALLGLSDPKACRGTG
jgi:eukaryotic-like serine/threonine-protein kinase